MVRRPTKRRVGEYVLAGVLALAVVWLLILVWSIAQKEEIARHAAQDTKAQLATLTNRKTALENTIQDLETPRGEEATLRQTYGVAKPGEDVIIVVPSAAATTTPALPWWKKVLQKMGL